MCFKPTQEGGQETFKEDGIILRLVQLLGFTEEMQKRGLHPHPYIKHEIRLCFRKSEKETDYADNAIQLLDGVFGKTSHSKPLFGQSVAAKRDMQAKAEMAKLMGGVMKAAINGESGEGLEEQFAQAQQSAADAQTEGLSIYSRRADEAENSVAG